MYLRPHALARLLLILPETSNSTRDLAKGEKKNQLIHLAEDEKIICTSINF